MSSQEVQLTNGERASSKVLSHLHSYPVVHDLSEGFKSDPRGSKILALAAGTYNRFLAPFTPYLRGPYSYVHPYIVRVDQIGDNTLSRLETRVPIVKEDTDKVKKVALSPLTYVSTTYQDEYKKTHRREGPVKTGIAVLSSQLKIFQDGCQVVLNYLSKGKEVAAKKIEEEKQQQQ